MTPSSTQTTAARRISPRDLLAPCIIAGAAMLGFSLLVLGPTRSAHQELQATIERERSLAASAESFASQMPALSRAASASAAALRDIDTRSSPARDAASLTALIDRLASESHVIVLRTQPRDAMPALPAAKEGETAVRPQAAVAVSIDAAGEYEQVSSFIHRLQTQSGFARVPSVRLTPDDSNPGLVRASIASLHFAFSPPTIQQTAASEGAQTVRAEVQPEGVIP